MPGSVTPSTTEVVARSTPTERLVLAGTIVLFPFLDHMPGIGGFSLAWLYFASIALFVLGTRPNELFRVLQHRVFLVSGCVLCGCFILESMRADRSYGDLFRIAQMFAGAAIVATLCRDDRALRSALTGYIIAGVWFAGLLFLTSYGYLMSASAADFAEASALREQAFAESPLQANLNRMSFFCAQGMVTALIFGLAVKKQANSLVLFGVAAFCLVATFLPLSRSGILIAVLSSGVLLFAEKAMRDRAVTAAIIFAAAVLVLVPGIVFTRFTFSTELDVEDADSRTHIYATAMETLPEYWLAGVGAGNYYAEWGYDHGFAFRENTIGPHNAFLQFWVFWGLPGVVGLALIAWQGLRCLPARVGGNALFLGLAAIALALFLRMLVTHNLEGKEFALGLGILVGMNPWMNRTDAANVDPNP